MKLIIMGASGFVARQIIPELASRGWSLLLVSRTPDQIRMSGPNVTVCGYDGLERLGQGADAVLYLAAKNNNQAADQSSFAEVNVDFLEQNLAILPALNSPLLIYASTVHAATKGPEDLYAESKRQAEQVVAARRDGPSVILRLATVYGSEFPGWLSGLSVLPAWLRRPVWTVFLALKPGLSVGRLCNAIEQAVQQKTSGLRYVVDSQKNNKPFQFMKRLIDLGFAFTILIVLWWLLALIWLAVRVTSSGPGLFIQARIGKDGQPFQCYKFRTMKTGTRSVATHEVGPDVVTGLGRFLRRSKLDELPQIFNILLNDISLVGPRPCLPTQTVLIDERRQKEVLAIKPGITGWAQINDVDMSDPAKLAVMDAEYIALQSVTFDIGIILKTFLGRGRGDPANR